MQFTCPHCRYSSFVRDDSLGQTGNCPGCQTPITISGHNTIASAPAPTVIVQNYREPKSVPFAILLTLFFGPFGMLYSTPVGALTMIAANVIIVIPLCFVVVGFFLIPVTWVIQILWAAYACDN